MNLTAVIKSIQERFVPKNGDTSPFRDWFFITSIGAVLVLISLAVNTTLFLSTVEEEKTFVPEKTQELTDEEALNATEQAFIERTLERERFETDYQFVDPSLLTE